MRLLFFQPLQLLSATLQASWHACADVPESWLSTRAPGRRAASLENAATWTPSETPLGRLKAVWFGASRKGPTPPHTLVQLPRYSVVGFGWQMDFETAKATVLENLGKGDVAQHNAVSHARAYLEGNGNNQTMLFMYRQIQVALRLFAKSGQAADNPENERFWLHDANTGILCLANQPWTTWDPYWNFSNADATKYWLDVFVEQLVRDTALVGGRGAVFFDEVDQGTCGYDQPSAPSNVRCDFSAFDGVSLQRASNAMLGKMVRKLNRAGIVPILSLDNRMRNSTLQLHSTLAEPCAVPEDELVDELDGTTWVRFYEGFPRLNWQSDSPDLWAATIENVILETQAGIPTILHYTDAKCSQAGRRQVPREGRMGGPIEFLVAAYLIVQGPGTTLSISDNWYDENFCWWPEFDVDFGVPLGPPVRKGLHTWARNYTAAQVSIDVTKTFTGNVFLLTPAHTPEPTPEPTPAPMPAATLVPTFPPTVAHTPAPSPESTTAPTSAHTPEPSPEHTTAPMPMPTPSPTPTSTRTPALAPEPTPAPSPAPTPETTPSPAHMPALAPEPTPGPTEAALRQKARSSNSESPVSADASLWHKAQPSKATSRRLFKNSSAKRVIKAFAVWQWGLPSLALLFVACTCFSRVAAPFSWASRRPDAELHSTGGDSAWEHRSLIPVADSEALDDSPAHSTSKNNRFAAADQLEIVAVCDERSDEALRK